jgi:hypothetical protein
VEAVRPSGPGRHLFGTNDGAADLCAQLRARLHSRFNIICGERAADVL